MNTQWLDANASIIYRLGEKFTFDPDGCWRWHGACNTGGYAQIWHKQRLVKAHRFIYELLNCPVAPELDLDHLCRVRHCVNPAHLEPVTRRENIRRGENFLAPYLSPNKEREA